MDSVPNVVVGGAAPECMELHSALASPSINHRRFLWDSPIFMLWHGRAHDPPPSRACSVRYCKPLVPSRAQKFPKPVVGRVLAGPEWTLQH